MRSLFVSFLLLVLVNAQEPVVVANGALCENKATGFFVMDNTALVAIDSIIYRDTSEEECMKTCLENRDQFGRSILCSSFVYDHSLFTCTIYKDKSAPSGKGQQLVAVGKRYFEKICLNDETPLKCADAQFIRVDDYVLAGYAVEVTLAETIEDCVAHCTKNDTCKSAMFFYEEKECIVNTETALSKPDGFTKEDNDRVIYFQNACAHEKVPEKKGPVVVTPAPPKPQRVQPQHTTQEPQTTEQQESSEEVEGSDEDEEEGSGEPAEESQQQQESGEEEDEETNVSNSVPSTEEPSTEETEEESTEEASTEQTSTSTSPSTTAEPQVTKEDFEEVQSTEHVASSKINPEEQMQGETATDYEDDEEDDENSDEFEEDEEDENVEEEPKNNGELTSEEKDKLAEKAGYIKFKKHPRNFASKTLKGDATTVELESAENDGEFHDENNEPVEGETKPAKKSSLQSIQIHEVPATQQNNNYFSEWSDWTPCTKAGERQIRRRKCVDLTKCLGALMQVQKCPEVLATTEAPREIESIRSVIGVPDDVIPEQGPLTRPQLPPRHQFEEASIWSPWLGSCQQFASSQPCNDGQMIGFESRECIAKDPSYCEGPFFRYCTISC